MVKIILYALLMFVCSYSWGQATIKGKVFDEKGEPLIGVVVMQKTGKVVVASTDIDGVFKLSVESQKVQVIEVRFLGYKTIVDTIFLKSGEERLKNYIMDPASVEIKDVEVIGRVKKSDDKYMESVKAKSVSTMDFISSATIRKTGDANVVAAVGRVSGVSNSGSFITVRGIGDRYVKTGINGMRIPTLDPFTNNIKLDMFPTSLIDNVVLTKTASADLPGDWAGAYMSVDTKDYPDKLSINIETQFGLNNATFKPYLSSERSNTDWLGFDKSLREYDHSFFREANMDPSIYDEFVALGYDEYFKSLGVDNNLTWNQNSDTYFKLGLVEIGLLDKSNINNADAYKKAKSEFDKQYSNIAFDVINKQASESYQAFSNSWSSKMRTAPLNTSQSFSIGNKTILFNRVFGYFIGFKYSSSVQYDPNSLRYKANGMNYDKTLLYDSLNQKAGKETNTWSALFSLNYRFNKNNNLSLLFMPNMLGVNNVRDIITNEYIQDKKVLSTYSTDIFYESRKQMIYQLKSENKIPGPDLKINLNASYTDGESNAPDFKSCSYQVDSLSGEKYGINGANRYFRYIKENTLDNKLDMELPIFKNSELSKKLKFGGAYQYNTRYYDQYNYYNKRTPASAYIENFEPTDLDNYVIKTYTINGIEKRSIAMMYDRDDMPLNHTIGQSKILAGYSMFDVNATKRIRVSGGARIENANVYTDVALFDSLKLNDNDGRRRSGQDQVNKVGELDETNILPSIACTYKIRNDEKSPVNLKLNFAQTLARPSIRELSDIRVYDYELKNDVTGNPNLKMVYIDNYDARVEYYTADGDNISLNLFYKDFKNHIELVDFNAFGYIWINSKNRSWLKGFELEGKKSLTKQLEFRSNLTIVNSQSTIEKSFKRSDGSYVLGDTVTHTMFGQAPYIINAILAYTSDSLKLGVTLSYNVQGSRIVITGGTGSPDIYERPRHLFDAKITKQFGKHFTVGFTIKDILGAPNRRTYKLDNVWLHDYDIYDYGTAYNFSLSYKL